MSKVELYHGNCLEIMPTLPQVDAIITDLPYGTTACSWDEIIPFEPMWKEIKRILKPRGVFVTTASQPFTSKLVMSNLDWFKYEWIWEKTRPTGFFTAKVIPMKIHENIIVFSKNGHTYNPQKTKADKNKIDKRKTFNPTHSHYINITKNRAKDSGMRFPITIQKFNSISEKGQHPTQKPVGLLEYLIQTYTNEGDTVLDICAGSGTTGVAAINTGRNAILIEKESKYIEIIERRIAEAQMQPSLLEIV